MIAIKTYARGDVFYADLGMGVGSEQIGKRPVLIVQNNKGNKYSTTVIIAPITSKLSKTKIPTHYHINNNGFLPEHSLVLLEQMRTIDKKRISEYLGHFDNTEMIEINKKIRISLGLDGVINE